MEKSDYIEIFGNPILKSNILRASIAGSGEPTVRDMKDDLSWYTLVLEGTGLRLIDRVDHNGYE